MHVITCYVTQFNTCIAGFVFVYVHTTVCSGVRLGFETGHFSGMPVPNSAARCSVLMFDNLFTVIQSAGNLLVKADNQLLQMPCNKSHMHYYT
jgi:hypothetical protein